MRQIDYSVLEELNSSKAFWIVAELQERTQNPMILVSYWVINQMRISFQKLVKCLCLKQKFLSVTNFHLREESVSALNRSL